MDSARVSHRITFEGKAIHLLNIYYPPQFSMADFYREMGVYPMPSILYHVVELIEEQTEYLQPDHWKYELLATTNHILPHIISPLALQLRLPTTDHPVVSQIISAIQRNYREAVTVEQISREIGLSVRTLSRHMNHELHITFVQYLRIYRILMAIKQMVDNRESITNIAYNVGYDSLTAFSNSFFKVTGCRRCC